MEFGKVLQGPARPRIAVSIGELDRGNLELECRFKIGHALASCDKVAVRTCRPIR